jgi:RNA polymerase sigma-70 factor (ECF subfamily)
MWLFIGPGIEAEQAMLLVKKQEETTFSDLELVVHYKQSGEVYYAGVLFQRYTHLILGLCLKYFKNEEDSKDAVMDIFEQLTVALLKHEVTNFKSWLHTLTRNHCLMKLRKPEVKRMITQDVAKVDENLFMEKAEDEHLIDEDEREAQLRHLPAALSQLNAEQKACIELFYLQDKNYQEVADATGYNLNQVKSYIQNGKRNLKILLDRLTDFEK